MNNLSDCSLIKKRVFKFNGMVQASGKNAEFIHIYGYDVLLRYISSLHEFVMICIFVLTHFYRCFISLHLVYKLCYLILNLSIN